MQNPGSTQGYNRYSYGRNNPLVYTDPSGYLDSKTIKPGGWNTSAINPPVLFGPGAIGTGVVDFQEHGHAYWYDWNSGKYLDLARSGKVVDYQEIRTNYVEPKAYATITGSSAGNFYNDWYNGMNIYEVQAFGNTTLVGAFGELGPARIGTNGGIGFYNPTAGAYLTGGVLLNPTGTEIRNQDGYGDGHYGAPRGNRNHMGIDIVTTVGQNVVSPVTGTAVNFTGATSGKPMVDITPSDASLGISKIRMLYVNMPNGVSAWQSYNVQAGQTVIGTAANMVTLGYPSGINPHVHIQVMQNGQWVDPTPFFFGN